MKNDFWKVKSMKDFTQKEWEQICLKCGKCCVFKWDDGKDILFSNRLCDGFDVASGLCKRYDTRICDDCLKVDFKVLCEKSHLLPEECAYRMLKEKGYLPEYHPLITGYADSVKKAKQTVLDWEGAHSVADLRKATAEVVEKAKSANWSKQEFSDALKEAAKPYSLIVVRRYKKRH